MAWQEWLLFTSVALINVMSPGPAILLAISNGVSGGMRSVVYGALGNICGLFMVSSLSMFGVGALLSTSASLFLAVKILGAGYLIYLGINKFRQLPVSLTMPEQSSAMVVVSPLRKWREGALIALTNPKAILFFVALFPQFLNTQAPVIEQFLLMTGTFMALSLICLCGYGWLGRAARHYLAEPAIVKAFHRLTGGLFIGLGVLMLQLRSSQS